MINIILILTFSQFLSCGYGLVAYDCRSTSPKLEFSLVDTPPCIRRDHNITTTNIRIQLLQPHVYDTTAYFSCLVEARHLVSRCGKSIDTLHDAGLYSEIIELSRDECKTLIEKGYWKSQSFLIQVKKTVSRHSVSLTTFGSISDGSCESGGTLLVGGRKYDRAVRQTDFTITTTSGNALVEAEDKKIVLQNGIRCAYDKLECFSADIGQVFWETITPINNCQDAKNYDVIYEGTAKKIIEHNKIGDITSYFLQYDEYDFQIVARPQQKRVCGVIAVLIEHQKPWPNNTWPEGCLPLKSEKGLFIIKLKII